MNSGWIKLHRKILEHPRANDPDWGWLWVNILALASHEPKDVIFGGERITLNPGEFTTGRKKLASLSGVSESKVQRLLSVFESEHQIEQRSDRQCRLIKVKNWNEYQQSEQRNEQRLNNDRTTSEQRVNTNKEIKENKEIKKYNISPHDFQSFVEYFNKTTGRKYTPLPAYRNKFRKRRDVFSRAQLEEAVLNASKDAFLRGDNENKKDYLTLEYILRNDQQVDRWLQESNAKKPAKIGDLDYY